MFEWQIETSRFILAFSKLTDTDGGKYPTFSVDQILGEAYDLGDQLYMVLRHPDHSYSLISQEMPIDDFKDTKHKEDIRHICLTNYRDVSLDIVISIHNDSHDDQNPEFSVIANVHFSFEYIFQKAELFQKIMENIAKSFVLKDSYMLNNLNENSGYAFLGHPEKKHIWDEEAWKMVAPSIEIPRAYE